MDLAKCFGSNHKCKCVYGKEIVYLKNMNLMKDNFCSEEFMVKGRKYIVINKFMKVNGKII